MLLFNLGGIVLVEKINSNNQQVVIQAAMNKHSNTKSIIELNNDNMVIVDFDNDNSLKNWLEITINGYILNDVEPYYIELFSDNNERIISNFNAKINGKREEVIEAKRDEKSFIIRDVNNEKYIFVSSKIVIKNRELKLVTSNSIPNVYDQKKENYKFFFIIGLIDFFALSIGMSFISRNLTEPLVKLSNLSIDIANGDYSKKIGKTDSTTEIAVLENNFNLMIDVIEENIKELQLLNESKQRFIDSLNHEIKTSITSIIGYSDLLLKSKVCDRVQTKALSYINREGKRVESLNSTLLKLILIREKNIEVQTTNINEIITSVMQIMN